MQRNFTSKIFIFLIFIFFSFIAHAQKNTDPLPSWNEGTIKNNIIQFVQVVTDPTSADFIPSENRIATFDNDGTLWVEQPMYTQVLFAFDRIKTLASTHPEWKNQEPFKSVLNNHYDKLNSHDLGEILATADSGMTTDDYTKIAANWLSTAKNQRFKRHYTELVYQPMLEVMQYLRKNNFNIYIVSGGEQGFMRTFSQKTYGIPPEQVIGSTQKTKYIYQDGKPQLVKLPQVLFITNNTGKPESINLFIGKKPIIAFGNSTGDQQMLEWTQSNHQKTLMLLVHHDDAKREYAYGPHSKVGTFSNALMDEAIKNHWQVISMKNDWKVIFPFKE